MKNNMTKILTLSLCAVLAAGAAGGTALALDRQAAGANFKPNETTATAAAADTKAETAEVFKDETVYVLANADGSVKKVIVSDWLKNSLGEKSIGDSTALTDVVNVKGDESFTTDNSGHRVWDAEGNDIYYQGNIDKELPVAMKVSYTLGGKSISPDEIKGRSGKVTIRYDFENKQSETVKINGKDETIYVPFAMLTGMILDNDTFRNIEVSNGKLINDGSRTIVAGLAFPGLQEDLGIDKETFEIPDYIEITADAENFSLGMTVTIAANGLFNELDPEKLDSTMDLDGSLGELSDGMKQLIDGSSQLYDGLCTLLEKSEELAEGIDQLAAGAESLKNGAAELDGGIGQLQDGAGQLSDGLNTLAANNDTLNGGAKQVFESLLSTAKTQLTAAGLTVPDMTIENYDEVLTSVIDTLDDEKVYAQALKTVTEAVEAKRGYIRDQVTAAVKTQVEAGVKEAVKAEVEKKVTAAVRTEVEAKVKAAVQEEVQSKVTEAVKAGVAAQVTEAVRSSVAEKVIMTAAGMDKASYDQAVTAGLIDKTVQTAITSAIDAQMNTDEVKQAIEQTVAAQMASDMVTATIKTQTESQMETDTIQQTIAQNTEAQLTSDTVKALIASKTAEQMESQEVQQIIHANVSDKMKATDIQNTIAQKTDEQVQKAIADTMAGDEVKAKLAGASEGAKKVIELKSSLNSYNTFYVGLQSYTGGVAQAADGAAELKAGTKKLKDGSSALSDGASQLYDGILTLKNGIPALADGVTQLRDGSLKLSDGLKEFNEKGIQKIIDTVDGDLSGLVERVKAVINVSKSYRNFAGISDEMNGQVKFIYRTDGIDNE